MHDIGQELFASQRFHSICLLEQQPVRSLDLFHARITLEPHFFSVDLLARFFVLVLSVLLPSVLLLAHGFERIGPL